MAKKSVPPSSVPPSSGSPAADGRTAAIDALMALAAERDWDAIQLPDIAERAGLSLAGLRPLFPSKGAILAAFSRRIDETVLGGIDPGMASEPPRERLFDTMMRRIDALGPHKEAVRRIGRSIARDPLSLAAWNRVVVNAMQWMLAASAIDADGPGGAMRAQGLAIAWSRVVKVWLDDEDEGLARTMTEIDRQLRNGERMMARAHDLWRLTRPFRRIAECSMRRRSGLRGRVKDRFNDLAAGRSRRDYGPGSEAAEI
jgi:AcrR family transcriptional regulator